MQRILSLREKLILIVTVVIIAIAIGFNLFIVPVLTKNAALNNEINIARSKLKKYAGLLNRKEHIHNEYNKIALTLRRNDTEKNGFMNLLTEMENLAKQAKIQIIDIRPQGTTKTVSSQKESRIELRTEGDLESYPRFIYNIENSALLLTIDNFQLNSKPNSQFLEGNFLISQISLD